jgi:D-alanyl-D-alanine dipeptidase
MALDATLIDTQGRELDMGSGFDEMMRLSPHGWKQNTWPRAS